MTGYSGRTLLRGQKGARHGVKIAKSNSVSVNSAALQKLLVIFAAIVAICSSVFFCHSTPQRLLSLHPAADVFNRFPLLRPAREQQALKTALSKCRNSQLRSF